MEWRELIVDGFERLPDLAEEALSGVRAADLDWPPRPGCNPLGWTVWHLTRVQDGRIADLMGECGPLGARWLAPEVRAPAGPRGLGVRAHLGSR